MRQIGLLGHSSYGLADLLRASPHAYIIAGGIKLRLVIRSRDQVPHLPLHTHMSEFTNPRQPHAALVGLASPHDYLEIGTEESVIILSGSSQGESVSFGGFT